MVQGFTNFYHQSHIELTRKIEKGWGDFLQTGRIQTQDIKFLSFEESSKWARLNKIIKSADWINSKNRPKNIPSNPQRTYKEQWKGWADIL